MITVFLVFSSLMTLRKTISINDIMNNLQNKTLITTNPGINLLYINETTVPEII